VDGVAEFGSRATSQVNISSDYDLLVLVKAIPTRVFQMVTTIGGRLADIVLVEIETADTLLITTELPRPKSFEALFAQKMQTAKILYDASERLHKVKQLVMSLEWQVQLSNNQMDSDLYATWFWQGFGLLHLERMAQSQDPIYLSAVDMMLTSCLPGTWRSYFDIRKITWKGETAAIRFWENHDIKYLKKVKKCLESSNRNTKLLAYRELVEHTLEPIGKSFHKGETVAILSHQNKDTDVQSVLEYWQSLFGSSSLSYRNAAQHSVHPTGGTAASRRARFQAFCVV
jgi:hypothetical protein